MLSTTSELESDDSLYKYRRKTRRQRVSSSFSSDTDDSIVVQPHRRRKKCRVSSSSSDSEDSLLARPSRKKCKVISDSESESTSSSDSEEDKSLRRRHDRRPNRHAVSSNSEATPEKNGPPKAATSATHTVEFSSDSDEGEKCIICFKTLNPPFAHPSNCTHHFHPNCLATWTKTSNTCPIDRTPYTAILVVDNNGDLISRESVTAPPPQDHNADFEPDDATFCEVCSQHDREHEMLLCDRCEAGYHLDCLTPPLRAVPDGSWFCPRCTDPNNELAEELNELMDDAAIILETRMRQRSTTSTRMPSRPRTRGAQRVFNIIHHQQTSDQPSTSSVTIRRHRPSLHRTRRSKSSRRPQSTRYKVELITVEDGTTLEVKVAVNTRTRTKSKKHSRRKSKKKCSKSSHKSGGPSTSRDAIFTGEGPSHSLDLFGSRPQLDYFSGCEAEDELDEDGGRGGGVGVLHHGSRPGVRNMASRKQIAAQILNARPRRPPPRIEVSRAPVDLVSSIIEQQEKWHSPGASYQSTSTGDIRVIMKESSSRMRQAGGSSGSSSGNPPSISAQTSSSSSQPPRDRSSSSGSGGRSNDTADVPRQSSAPSSSNGDDGQDLSKTSGSRSAKISRYQCSSSNRK
uniref:PHD and RING finger domain-containing protein 1 n=1 Tax=Lygus hesperus TaxID=30085 RepID=A0A146L8A2_LYGHE